MLSRSARVLRGVSGVGGVCGGVFDAQARSFSTRVLPTLLSRLEDMSEVEDLAKWAQGVSAEDGVRTMVVKIGGEVLQRQLPELTASLQTLLDVGVLPVIVHGGGPQLTAEMARLGVEPQYSGGHRITDKATMGVASMVFSAATDSLCAHLRSAGIACRGFGDGRVLEAGVAEGGALGLVGEVSGVRVEALGGCLHAGEVPVLNSLGTFAGVSEQAVEGGVAVPGGLLNINADVAARELAVRLQPERVVFVSAGGGWREEGEVVRALDMERDFERLQAQDYTGRQGTLLKLREVKALTDALPPTSRVVICGVEDVGRQVGAGGGGTQIRKGVQVSVFSSLHSADAARVKVTLRNAGVDEEAAEAEGVWVVATADYGSVALVAEGGGSGEASASGGFGASGSLWGEEGAVVGQTRGAGAAGDERGGVEGVEEEEEGVWVEAEYPRLVALALEESASETGAEEAMWEALKESFPTLWWTSGQSGLRNFRAHRHAAGVMRISTPTPAVPAVRAAADLEPDAGVDLELQVAGGSAPPNDSPLLSHPTVAWWGLSDLEEAEIFAEIGALEQVAQEEEEQGGGDGEIGSGGEEEGGGGVVLGSGERLGIALVGARGFTGRELVRLLAHHPEFAIVAAGSRAMAGLPVAQALGLDVETAHEAALAGSVGADLCFEAIEPDQVAAVADRSKPSMWVLALPNGQCDRFATEIAAADSEAIILDLSADKRFEPPSSQWVYGLPELKGQREALLTAKAIANPGCYATGAQTALFPIAHLLDTSIPPHVFGVSGYSGAGSTPSDKNDPQRLRDNLLPYALTNHIHEREIGHRIPSRVAFSPHVAPFFQGISLTLSSHIDTAKDPSIDWDDKVAVEKAIHNLFAEFYQDDKLIRILSDQVPDVKTHGSFHQGVTIGGFSYHPQTRRLAHVSTIDNLLKGAATQALQNLNLAALGTHAEYHGIPIEQERRE